MSVQYSYTSTPPMGRTSCTESHCLYSTAIPLLPLWAVRPVQSLIACTVQLYLYSPYGPYGLYRASVPVQYSYTSTPPMGRTAFTEPQCLYRQLYLYSPYGPTPCTEPQCLYSTAIPLLPLWTVRLVQNLSACTVQLYLYSPQCLYSTAIPLLPLWAVRPVRSLSDCTLPFYLWHGSGGKTPASYCGGPGSILTAGGQIANKTSARSSTSVFPCEDHFIDVPHSVSPQYHFCKKDEWAKHGQFQTKQCSL